MWVHIAMKPLVARSLNNYSFEDTLSKITVVLTITKTSLHKLVLVI